MAHFHQSTKKITIEILCISSQGKDSAFLGVLKKSMGRQWRKAAIFLVLMFCWMETQGASGHHLCGIHLVDALLLVCEGKGLYYRNYKGLAPSLIHRLSERNKRKVGIVEKCCHQSCTFYDLQTYCKT